MFLSEEMYQRSREAIIEGIETADNDAHCAGGSKSADWYRADAVLSCLEHAGIKLVDAADDDRRTAELAAGRELVHALVQWDMCAGKGTCNEAFVRIKTARRGFAPYLHDDDTGGER